MTPEEEAVGPRDQPPGENDGKEAVVQEEVTLQEIADAVNTEAAVHEGKRGGRWHATTVSRVLRRAKSGE